MKATDTLLDCFCGNLTVDNLRDLLAEPRSAGWVELILDCNAFGNEGAALLASWEGISRVVTLSLGDTEIRIRGLKALCESPYHPRPIELELGENPLYDKGVELLASSPLVSRVRRLGLSCTGIDHRGVEALVASPHLSALETLDLTQTELLKKSWKLLRERFPEVVGSY